MKSENEISNLITGIGIAFAVGLFMRQFAIKNNIPLPLLHNRDHWLLPLVTGTGIGVGLNYKAPNIAKGIFYGSIGFAILSALGGREDG